MKLTEINLPAGDFGQEGRANAAKAAAPARLTLRFRGDSKRESEREREILEVTSCRSDQRAERKMSLLNEPPLHYVGQGRAAKQVAFKN